MSRIEPGKTRRPGLGFSLIEVMVAMTIGILLLLGLSQIFLATKVTYQLQEGLSHIQENARFGVATLERNVRMAGYMGCGNDLNRIGAFAGTGRTGFLNHLTDNAAAKEPAFSQRFQRPLEAFEYTGGSTANAAPVAGAVGDWTPNLPASLTSAAKPIKGSDVLVVRYFSEESTPVIAFVPDPNSLTVADDKFMKKDGIYAISNCLSADLFKAVTVAGAVATAPWSATGNMYQYDATNDPKKTWDGLVHYESNGAIYNAEVFRAQYMAFYVAIRPSDKQTALYITRFADDGTLVDEDFVDGVDAIKVQFGVNESVPRADAVTKYYGSKDLVAGISTPEANFDARWRDVRSVRIGMLLRGQERATAVVDKTYSLLGQTMDPANDKVFRQVYETTISMRNRIGNAK